MQKLTDTYGPESVKVVFYLGIFILIFFTK